LLGRFHQKALLAEKSDRRKIETMSQQPPRRRGGLWNAIWGGVFLIGLGLVFYAVTYLKLSWENAWPLIIILIGILIVGGGVSRYYSGAPEAGEKAD